MNATNEKPSQWAHILTAQEIDARFELTASLDPAFARDERNFYGSRSILELRSLMNGAWNANDADGYQLARSFLGMIRDRQTVEMKRRHRMAVSQARDAREMGDRFTAAWELGHAGRCRAKLAEIAAAR